MKDTLLYIFIFFIVISCTSQKKDSLEANYHDNPVIAHRGAWKNTGYPQNSIASLKAAIALKCHGSEIDVQLTKEDSLIVFHDIRVRGMAIDSMKYTDLITVPLANGERIPTLRNCILEAKKQVGTKLIIDIKTPHYTPRAKENAEQVLKLVKELRAETLVEFLVGDLEALEYLISETTIPVAYLGRWKNELPVMYPDSILQYGVKYLDYQDVHYKKHPEWISKFQEENIHLNAWTINEKEDMIWFIEKNFDYITTDEPELLLDIVRERLVN